MANNASATVDLKILISVIQNQSQSLRAFQQQVQSILQQLQTAVPQGAMAGLAGQVTTLNTQVTALQGTTAKGVTGVKALESAVGSLTRGIKFLAGGFLALQSIQFIKGLADAAARSEVLATVLHVVATNAGYTKREIDDVWMKVQRLGISSDAAAQALTQLMQGNIKIEFAEPLARAAQDLAVIEGSDSSATFERLISAIQRLNTLSLRRMGIVVSMTQAEARYRQEHKDIVGDLNSRQRSEALLVEVLEKSKGLQGTYEAAMGNVAKQVGSLKRLFGDLREELGKQLLPAYSALVSELSLFLKQMTLLVRAGNDNMTWAEQFGEAVRVMARRFFEAVKFIYEHRVAIEALAAAYATYWAVVAVQKVWDHSIVVVETLTKAIWGTVTAIRAATTATVAWAAANGLLGAAAAARAAGAGVQLALPFAEGPLGKAAAGAGAATFLTTMRTFVTTAGPRLVQLLGQIGPLLWSAAAATTAWFISLGPIVGAIVALSVIFGGFLVFLYNFTSVGETMQRTWGHIKDLFGELGKQVGNTVNLAFSAFNETVEASGSAVNFLSTQLKALGIILDALPGKPLTQVDRMFQGLNIALEFYKIQLAINSASWAALATAGTAADKAGADKLVALRANIQAALQEVTDAETAVQQAGARGIAPGSDLAKPHEDRWKAAGDKLKALQKEETELKKKLTPEAITIADLKAAFNKNKAEETAIYDAMSAAEAKLGRVVLDGKSISKDFADANSNVQAMIEGYELLKKQKADAIAGKPLTFGGGKPTEKDIAAVTEQAQAAYRQMFTAIEAAGPKVTDTVARDMLFQQISRVIGEAGPDEKRMLAGLGTSVGIQIAKYISPAVAASESLRAAAFKNAEARTAADLDHRLEMTRAANEKQELADRERLAREGRFQDEFNFRQLGRQQAIIDLELAQGENRIKSLRRQQIEGIDRDPEAQMNTRRELAKAEQEQLVLQAKKINEVASLGNEQREAALKLSRDITLSVAQQVATYGTLDQTLEAIRLKYDAERQDRKSGDTSDIDLRQQKDIYDARVKFLERDLALSRDARRERSVAIEFEQQILELAKERVEMDLAAGKITPIQAMRQQNALLLLEIETASKKLLEDRVQLEIKNLEYTAKRALIVEDMAKAESDQQSPETRARIMADLGKLKEEIDALTLSTTTGAIKIDRMAERMVNYGKQFRDVFQSSLAQMLTDIATFNGKLVDTVANFGKALSRQFFKSIFENVASKITETISKIGSKETIDAAGNKSRTPGVFENMFKWMGLGAKADGSNENPFSVIVKNIQAIAGRQAGFAQTVDFKQAALSMASSAAGGIGGTVAGVAQLGMAMFQYFNRIQQGNRIARALDFTMAEGGPVNGPGTGTSDSIPAMLSAGEHVMPAAKAALWMPVLEAIRTGRLQTMATGGLVQAVAFGSVIPRRYAGGGIVQTDGGAAAVQTGAMGGNMMVQLHPEALNMTMRDWLEHEVVRQHSRR